LIPDSAAASAVLMGSTTVTFSNGTAEFTDLRITHAGTHQITFQIVSPTTVSVAAATLPVTITQRTVNVAVSSAVTLLTHGSNVDMTLELQNSIGSILEAAGYQGHTYTATVTLDSTTDSIGTAAITGTPTATFSGSTATISGMQISNTVDYYKYNLIISVVTNPALHNLVQYHTVEFYDPTLSLHTSATTGSLIKLKVAGVVARSMSRSTTSTNSFESFMSNLLTNVVNGTAYIATVVVNTVNSNTEIEATVNSVDTTTNNEAIALITTAFTNNDPAFTYNGQQYRNADSSCVVETGGVCSGSTTSSTSTSSSSSNSLALETWLIIVIALAISLILGILIVGITCYLKREKAYKYDTKLKGPMGCTAGTGSQSTIGTNLLRLSPGADSPDKHINDGYRTIDSRASSGSGWRNTPSRPISRTSPTSMTSSDTIQNLPRVET
jgi:hypothetical protein